VQPQRPIEPQPPIALQTSVEPVAAVPAPAMLPSAAAPASAPALARANRSDTTAARLPAWIVRPGDNICGLRDARMLSNPARVDLAALLEATPEMMLLARQGADPESAIWLQLRQQALDRCTRVCEALRVLGSHCSIWSAIEHRDRRGVPDLTELARARVGVDAQLE
jgi:hypothetical protein